ncbi:MAG: hypothetical protein ED557_00740 [Balneola sp.]|nr:MAG: hypothetical protein ED557_00740 [Balneola sp.]
MILKESELDDEDIIYHILGKPYKDPGKLLTATGSSMFFIREATDLEGTPLPLKREDMKGIFQRYENGLFFYLNKSNYRNGVLITYDSIKEIRLSKNIEERKSDASIFLRMIFVVSSIPILGSPFKVFRYINRESELIIETDFMKTRLTTSLSSFESIRKYFSSLDSADRFEVVE